MVTKDYMASKDAALRMAIEAMETHVPYYVLEKGYAPLIACKAALSDNEASSSSDAVTLPDVESLAKAYHEAQKAMLQAAPTMNEMKTCEKEKG